MAIVIALLGGAFSAPAFTVKTTVNGEYVLWEGNSSAVFFSFFAPPGLLGSEQLDQLDDALKAWEDLSQGNVRFICTGQLDASPGPDGVNLFSWETDWRFDPENLAVTTTWFDPDTGWVEEVDIEFNAQYFDWSNRADDSADLLTVALHELGHLLGVGHSFYPGAVMHEGLSSLQPVRRVLSRDDIDALRFLYPVRDCRFLLLNLDPEGEGISSPPRSAPGAPYSSFRRSQALTALDLDRDGLVSELATAWHDSDGNPVFECRRLLSRGPRRNPLIGARGVLPPDSTVVAMSSVDLNRDGFRNQLGVMVRINGREKVLFYDPLNPGSEPLALINLPGTELNSVVACDLVEGDYDSYLAILRVKGAGYILELHLLPESGEHINSNSPIVLELPGFSPDSRLLGMAIQNSSVGKRVLFLEAPFRGEAWIHAFVLQQDFGQRPIDLKYQNSSPIGNGTSLAPISRMAVVDGDWAGNKAILLLERR